MEPAGLDLKATLSFSCAFASNKIFEVLVLFPGVAIVRSSRIIHPCFLQRQNKITEESGVVPSHDLCHYVSVDLELRFAVNGLLDFLFV
jgi:hypothetical protein